MSERAKHEPLVDQGIPIGPVVSVSREEPHAYAIMRIPRKSAVDSERSRPLIPIEAGRGFR
jgi:hypothetical protein